MKDLPVTLRNTEKIFKISSRQKGGGLPFPESVLGQAGWGSEHPVLVEGCPGHGRALELDQFITES